MERRPFDLFFQLGSIPIVVEPSFWIFTALLGWDADHPQLVVAWVAICFVSILIHELGHALTMRAFGAGAAVKLYSFGGLAMPDRQLGRWQDLIVSLAGPFAGFFFGGGLLLVSKVRYPDSMFGVECLSMALQVNFFWGLVNLLPILPLDGGHVLRSLLGNTRRRIAFGVSMVTAAVVVAFSVWAHMTYVMLMFGLFAARNFQWMMAERPVQAQKPAPPEPDLVPRAWTALRSGDDREAARLGHLAIGAAKTPEALNAARDVLAWVSLSEGEPRAALRQLEQVSPPEAARAFSLAMIYDVIGMPERAVEHAVMAVPVERSDASAALAVRLLLGAGRVDEASAVASTHGWQGGPAKAYAEGSVLLARKEHLPAAERFSAAFAGGQRAEQALGAARAHAGAGQVERAVEWLRKAVDAGLEGIEELAAEPGMKDAVERVRTTTR